MSETLKIFLTSAVTVIGGAILLVFGQIATKLFIDPMLDIRKTIGQIAFNLVYHANVIHNAPVTNPNDLDKARDVYRVLSSRLRSTANTLPCYLLFSLLHFVPKKAKLVEASQYLIRLANTNKTSTYVQVKENSQTLCRLLDIEQALMD